MCDSGSPGLPCVLARKCLLMSEILMSNLHQSLHPDEVVDWPEEMSRQHTVDTSANDDRKCPGRGGHNPMISCIKGCIILSYFSRKSLKINI